MDFSKLKDGVVTFSGFLAGHVFWLGVTIYSVWVALGARFEVATSEIATSAIAVLQNDTTATLLKIYGIEPLMPAFALFLIIFVLHAHRELLEVFGRFIPPELVWHYMPGLRDISPTRWVYILGRLGPDVSFEDLQVILKARYPKIIASHHFSSQLELFNILKSLAILNAILCVAPSLETGHRLANFGICFVLILAAVAIALLQVYHARNRSRWAIEEILQSIMAESVGKQRVNKEEKGRASLDMEHSKEFWKADRRTPLFTLSWSLPLIGNLRILKESMARPTHHDDNSTGKGK